MSNSSFKIELIDYPGEWLLDLALLNIGYTEWSKKTIQWLRTVNDDLTKKFLNTLDSLQENISGPDVEMRLHNEYKNLLLHLKKSHYSQITPGRFIMPSDLANDPMLIFAPLPANVSKEMQKTFEKKYNKYIKDVVKDIHLEHFKDFQRQVVLVDVIEALQNGYACYSDMKSGLKNMLSLYHYGYKLI